MKFSRNLICATLIRRYYRFLADVQLESGEIITAHCPNSGSLMSVYKAKRSVLLSIHVNPKRKFKHTLELVNVNNVWVGINTMLPNLLVEEPIKNGIITELQGYTQIFREKNYGINSRIDLLLQNGEKKCFVEIKNVTLAIGTTALFPDSVTVRGKKHLIELMNTVKEGHRSMMIFVVQRGDCNQVKPADEIDPEYGKSLRKASKKGVEIIAYQADVNPEKIVLNNPLSVVL